MRAPASVDSCATDANLPTPACSGSYKCDQDLGFCVFQPRLFNDLDSKGRIVLYQTDADWDGVGDQCDNCPNVPNGIECRNPNFAYRCDADGDGITTPQEITAYGDQRNDVPMLSFFRSAGFVGGSFVQLETGIEEER